MWERKAVLALICCLFIIVGAGCTTPAQHIGQPLPPSDKTTQFADDSIKNALLELKLSIDRLADRPKADSSPYRWPAEPQVYRSIIGNSVENRPLECIVLGRGQDVCFILAAIHGNEQAGVPLVRRLNRYLQQHPNLLDGRKVVLLPVANPDGMAYNRRANSNGVDLNRNFMAANRRNNPRFGLTAFSEPEAVAINLLIQQYKPDRIVSLHQIVRLRGPKTAGLVDYDGPGKALADHMAQHCDLNVKKWGARPGSLGSYAGETLRIPIVTLELPKNAGKFNSKTLWDKYGNALIAAVLYPDRAK